MLQNFGRRDLPGGHIEAGLRFSLVREVRRCDALFLHKYPISVQTAFTLLKFPELVETTLIF